jgi:hypothetical protein
LEFGILRVICESIETQEERLTKQRRLWSKRVLWLTWSCCRSESSRCRKKPKAWTSSCVESCRRLNHVVRPLSWW